MPATRRDSKAIFSSINKILDFFCFSSFFFIVLCTENIIQEVNVALSKHINEILDFSFHNFFSCFFIVLCTENIVFQVAIRYQPFGVKINLDFIIEVNIFTYQKSSPAGLVLEFEIWRLISFIDDHFGPPWRPNTIQRPHTLAL